MTNDTKKTFLFSMLIGAGVATMVWFGLSRAIDRKLAEGGEAMLDSAERELRRTAMETIQAEVPPRVRAAVQDKLNEYGLTPAVGNQLRLLLERGESLGLYGVR